MMGAEINVTGLSMKTIFILCGLLAVSHCLYEDQIGKFDWLQSYIGKLKFAASDGSGKRVVVATEQNVIAAVNLKSGQIAWRQILEKERRGQIHFLSTANSGEAVVVTGDVRGLVRAFDSSAGSLAWEWLLPSKISLDRALWVATNDKLQVVTPVLGSHFEVFSFNLRNGAPLGNWEIVAPWAGTNKCAVAGIFIACVAEKRLHSVSIKEAESIVQTLELTRPAIGVSSLSDSDVAAVLIDYGSGGDESDSRRVVLLKEHGIPTIKCQPAMPNATVKLVSPEGGRGKLFFLQIVSRHKSVDIFTTDCISGQVVDELSGTVPWPEAVGTPKVALDMCGMRKDDSLLCRLLLHTEDHAIALLQYPGKVMWVREESLASILLVEMLDLPVSDTDAAIEKEFDNKEAGMLGMVGRRIFSQAMQIQHLFLTVLGLQEPTPAGGRRVDLVRDDFGLHKMIVVATGANKVFGIDNLSGEIVWQHILDDLESAAMQLFVQRTTRHGIPQCILLSRHKVTKEGVFYTFNPITGAGGIRKLGYRVQQAIMLPTMDAEFLRGLLLMDTSEQVHVEPKSAFPIALALAPTTYMYVAYPTTGLIAGYSLAQSNKERLVATRVWEVLLKPGVQTLLTVAGKSPLERVHSQGRVLADRSVLYKYVNPNLVAVVTQGSDPVHKYVLNVFLLDAVSGAIVFSVSHKRAREPVHVVHSENWLVYSYFSEKWRRTEVAAVELYEGKTQSNTVFSSLASPVQPLVERQSYILPSMVQAMRPTITEKGITSRHILVGLTSGMVLELPWMFLDPRRPVTATPEMREEGVIPYMPELPIPAESIINYNRTLPRISGIHTSPSGLESTSLVLVYGLDLFYTRVAPSKTFDLLKEDFDPFLISMVLIGLCLASYTTRRLASRKTLKAAWK